jgi:hypothetical protein
MNTSVDIMMATSYQEGNHHGFFKGGTFFMTIFGTLSHDHRQKYVRKAKNERQMAAGCPERWRNDTKPIGLIPGTP